MNQRKSRSLLTRLATSLAHLSLREIALFLCLTGPASSILASPPETNTAAANLADLPLESLMELEVPVVSSASKFAQKSTDAPAYVTVVSSDEIQRYGYRTLADLLRSVSGFYVSYDRNYDFLGVRGLEMGDFNSRTLLLVDGHRVNNNLTDGAYIDNAFILDLDLVDHVEIIRGPSAVLYGNNAFFGVINVVTRRGSQINGFEATGEYGSYDTYQGRLTFGKLFKNGVEMMFSGTLYHSAGEPGLYFSAYDTPENNNGFAKNLDGDTAGSAFGSVSYKDFTLEGAFNRRIKDNPTAQYYTAFNTPGLKTTDDRGYVTLNFAHEFRDDWNLIADAYYDYCDLSMGFPYATSAGNLLYNEVQTGEWWGTEMQLSKRLWDKHTIALGAEYRDDFLQHNVLYNTDTGKTYTDITKSQQSYGVYAEGDFELCKPLHFNGGVRYDQYGSYTPAIDPRLALIYNPLESSTFKAICGTAFRAPNFEELSDPHFQNITPENITSYELVYEQGIGRHLRSALSGFYNQMDDLIVFENGHYGNVNAESKGLELALEGSWANGLKLRASYTLEDAQNLSGSQSLPDSPEQLIKLNLSVPVFKEKLFASLDFQYTSWRSTYMTGPAGQTIPGLDVPANNVLNFTLLSRNLLKNLDVSASIYNLLDQHYSDPATPYHYESQIPQAGRSFGVKLTYRF